MFQKVFFGWWVVAACFLFTFYIGGAVNHGFTAFLEPIAKDLGWSYAQVSVGASMRSLAVGILAPLVGILVDRFGSRKLLFSGAFCIGCGFIVLGSCESLGLFYIAFALIALGMSTCSSTVLMTVVARWFKRKMGRATGLMISGFGAGGILVFLITAAIATYEWRMTSLLLGLGMWLIGIPLAYMISHQVEEYGSTSEGKVAHRVTRYEIGQKLELGLKEALRSRIFWQVATAELIRQMVISSVNTHIMPYLGSIGMSRSTSASIAATMPLVSIIGRVGLGWLSDVFDKRYVLAVGFSLMAGGMLAISYTPVFKFFPLFILPFSIGHGGCPSVRAALLREYFGRAAYGKIMGMMTAITMIGGIVGPILAGSVFDIQGSYRSLWVGFSAVLAMAIPTLIVF